jgi:CheY-like chemotaxis protein
MCDVVLTDLAMSGRDGRWLLGQVEMSARPVPVIAVTGYGDDYDLRGGALRARSHEARGSREIGRGDSSSSGPDKRLIHEAALQWIPPDLDELDGVTASLHGLGASKTARFAALRLWRGASWARLSRRCGRDLS